MKLKIKTLQQKEFVLDVEGTDSIGSVKSKIEKSHGFPVTSQKLIYSGKMLAEDAIIEKLGVKETDFMVLMVTKTNVSSSTTTAAAAAASTAAITTKVTSATSNVPTTPTNTPMPTSTTSATAPSSVGGVPSDPSFTTGTAFETAVQNMMEMGFPREQVVRAMRAAFNNPDRAVEYLMTSIPEIDIPGQQPTAAGSAPASQPQAAPEGNLFNLAAQQQQQQQGAARGRAGAAVGGGGADNLAHLMNNPQFEQLRQMVHANPQLIQPILQQLAATNPQLAQAVNSNPEAFMQMLMGEGGGNYEEGGEGAEGGAVPPGAHVIEVSEEEKAAIDRLCSLGFDRAQAIEAFLACDRNEEIAANFLFENQDY